MRAGISATHVAAQNRVSALETPTAGYTRLDLDASWRWRSGATEAELFALMRHAINEAYRLHTSFLKDGAPQPGRQLLLGLSAKF